MVSPRRSLRIVFFGSPEFAVPTLEALLTSAHQVVGVVTQPDRPRGRGQQLREGPVKVVARAHGVPTLQPLSLKQPEFVTQFAALGAELGVVAAYGKLLPESLLATPALGMINVHASLLPKYRGAAPIHRAIAAGEHETGISIMRVVKALDAGPVLAMARRPIDPNETSAEVERGLAAIGARLLVETVDLLANGTASETPQDDRASSYAPRLTKEDGLIDWARSAQALHDHVRAMHPWPHASTFLDGRRIIVLRTSVVEASSEQSGDIAHETMPPPGTVVVARGALLHVATGGGILQIDELQAEGSRPMTSRDFLAGHDIRPGHRFSTPLPAQGLTEPPGPPKAQ